MEESHEQGQIVYSVQDCREQSLEVISNPEQEHSEFDNIILVKPVLQRS